MKHLLGVFALLLVCSATSAAQGVQTGMIRGTVKDQQGLALPGATITATSPALQGERTVVTDTDGNYVFRALPPGAYSLKVEMSGMVAVHALVPAADVWHLLPQLEDAGASSILLVPVERMLA